MYWNGLWFQDPGNRRGTIKILPAPRMDIQNIPIFERKYPRDNRPLEVWTFLLETTIFRGYVSFRECTCNKNNHSWYLYVGFEGGGNATQFYRDYFINPFFLGCWLNNHLMESFWDPCFGNRGLFRTRTFLEGAYQILQELFQCFFFKKLLLCFHHVFILQHRSSKGMTARLFGCLGD